MTLTLLDNRYQLIRALGSGGFGETFLAEDTHLPSGRRCVIKQLRPVTNNPQIYQLVQERFQREAAILEELGEGNSQIPRLYAYFAQDGLFYLVQEWIDGTTLTAKVQQQGPLSESSVKEILVNILPVLDYVHSKRIVHRDIKPENIILRKRDGLPVLIDFGAVRETMGTVVTTGGNTTSSIVIGTPGYMPSEQSIGRPVYGSDLYSLGLTAIYLLTGKIPQQLDTDYNTGEIVWHRHALNVSPTFAAILERAIKSHPRDRYSTAREMLDALHSGVAPTVPFIQPTVPSPPANGAYNQQQTLVPPPANGAYNQLTATPTRTSGMADWHKAVIVGSVLGACMVAGFIASKPQSSPQPSVAQQPPVAQQPSSPAPISSSPRSRQPRAVSSPSTPSSTTPVSIPSPSAPPTSSITETQARNLIDKWLKAKRSIFAPPYDRQLGAELTTGKAYRDNIEGPNSKGEDSSREWLQKNNTSYSFGLQRIDSVERFEAHENDAIIDLVITEERKFYNKNGDIDPNSSGLDTRLVRYNLQAENGTWKISDYTTVRKIR